MALPASDNFNRANQDPLGGNWTRLYSGTTNYPKLVSNKVTGSTSSRAVNYWNADSFNNDQWSEIKLNALTVYCGCAVRALSDGSTYSNAYVFIYINSTAVKLYKTTSTSLSLTQIGSDYAISMNTGDTLKLAVSGTTLTPYHNGSAQATQSDSAFSSGAAGIICYGTSANLDDWSGGNVGGIAFNGPFVTNRNNV